jgi:hypothetical protein
MPPADPLQDALAQLRQLMTDVAFVISTSMELQASGRRLLMLLPSELRRIQTSIETLIPLLPSDEEDDDDA